jgi:CDP-diglyceride synthetase
VDDGFDFPPTAHPGRELFTAILFVLLVLALLIWGGWKLISLTSAARRPPPHHATVMMGETHYFLAHFRLSTFRRGN